MKLQHYEVDFFIKTAEGKQKLIQVAWNMENSETRFRETRALTHAMNELQVPGEIITLDNFLEKGGITAFLP